MVILLNILVINTLHLKPLMHQIALHQMGIGVNDLIDNKKEQKGVTEQQHRNIKKMCIRDRYFHC